MKIAAIMATRGNPKRAAAVIECANSLSSSKHEIEWVVGCDTDDKETCDYFFKNYPKIPLSLGPAPVGVGAVWNRGVACSDAEIITPFCDDAFPGLPNWDAVIADHLDAGKIGVVAWDDTGAPDQCTLPVLTRKWVELAGLYDERFPFWFYDTCVAETWSFVTGRRVEIPKRLVMAAKKGKTQSMRDLAFWWGFYVHTRQERIDKAAEIRAALEIEIAPDLLRIVLENWQHRDRMAAPHLEEMERGLSAAIGSPSARYLKAKSNAEAVMSLMAAA